MREIKGYVIVAEFENQKILFSKKTDDSLKGDYENFETNGLEPYATLDEVNRGLGGFPTEKTDLKKATLAKIEMLVAENIPELDFFKDKSELIVILKERETNWRLDRLLGPVVRGRRSYAPIPGAFLIDTDFQTYDKPNDSRTPYDRAEYLLKEVNRQAQCAATIATFKLEMIE